MTQPTEPPERTRSATAVVRIRGTHGAWKVAYEPGTELPLVRMQPTIMGSPQSGFHLVMDPESFFTADDWYATRQEAVLAAEETFGVDEADWVVGSA